MVKKLDIDERKYKLGLSQVWKSFRLFTEKILIQETARYYYTDLRIYLVKNYVVFHNKHTYLQIEFFALIGSR